MTRKVDRRGGGLAPAADPTGLRRLLVESPRPNAVRHSRHAHWLVVATVCTGAFMGQLDASIVTAAFPTLQRSFHAGVGGVTWVGLSYLLTIVSLIVAVGRLSDTVGRKLVYLYGFVLFVVGSLACGLAPDLPVLIACRVLQGVGAAMFQANSVAIIALALPRPALGRAIGVQGAAQALGLALGPTIGGLLISAGGWRLLFFVNVPTGVVAIAMAWYLLPRSTHLRAREPFDVLGLVLFVPSVAAVLSALSFGNRLGWTSPLILGLLVGAVLGGSAFVRRIRRVASPLLDPSLFGRAGFSAGVSSGLLSYAVMFGTLFVFPFFLERSLGQSTARAGLELAAMPVALGLVAPVAGRVAERLGARMLTVAGMAVVVVAMGLVALAHGSLGFTVAELALVGVGLGLFTPSNNAAIMAAAPREQSGAASGVLNMTRGMGTALGLACTALVLDAAGAGSSLSAPVVAHGLVACVLFLGGVAAVALVCAARRGGPVGSAP